MWEVFGKDKRKYQCFVCAVIFEDFVEFKDHIIAEHEEGREYVRCPLARCGAPVRDVTGHFKARHPNDKVPKNCQLKATVWRDFRDNKKRSKPEMKKGWFTSLKNNEKFLYRSGYELSMYELLEELNECVSWHGESFKIPYFFKGKEHNYIPDISVQFKDGSIEVWEVKPATQKGLPRNQAKWTAATSYCEARGWKFIIKSEQEIEELKMAVRRQNL